MADRIPTLDDLLVLPGEGAAMYPQGEETVPSQYGGTETGVQRGGLTRVKGTATQEDYWNAVFKGAQQREQDANRTYAQAYAQNLPWDDPHKGGLLETLLMSPDMGMGQSYQPAPGEHVSRDYRGRVTRTWTGGYGSQAQIQQRALELIQQGVPNAEALQRAQQEFTSGVLVPRAGETAAAGAAGRTGTELGHPVTPMPPSGPTTKPAPQGPQTLREMMGGGRLRPSPPQTTTPAVGPAVEKARAGVEAKMQGVNTEALAEAMASGQMGREDIANAFGIPVRTLVESEVLKRHPKFNFVLNEANVKWSTNATNQNAMTRVQAALPRLEALDDQLSSLPLTSIPAINHVIRQISIQSGQPAFTDYESNRNAIVQEINTALSGSATGSDFRVKIELENLNAARSPQQITAAIKNLRLALLSRLEAGVDQIYPPEVVRGEVSRNDFIKELRQKYAGHYGPAQPQAAPPGRQPSPATGGNLLPGVRSITVE